MLRTKLTAAVATGAVLVALCACGNAPAGSQGKATASAPAQQTKTVQIKKSPDKYTHYVKTPPTLATWRWTAEGTMSTETASIP